MAAAVALAGIGLTAVTSLIQLRQRIAVDSGGPVLGELQGRVADRLKIDMTGMIGVQTWTRPSRLARRVHVSAIALGLALLANIGALLYAVIH